ncbi:fungal-specific transcription factor domain-protein [Phialemonium atrogriseum]|uniref:Fungal-specific transcription factor domain-protein n=1 Tax=Phialemonium atrogriseum TaxID=1093897 RepID=A0AAJ0BRQ5_9PEZI|nr:fungal-specific transcription factor domain-protein [Phialemonium atrogriseum]KAK1763066.1 fungal-specific transcription factor domain-protein [Phialemonium atrogriseum]
MESRARPVSGDALARFACDFCQQKKLKCSKELPKCSTCRPWPGSCEYSRENLAPRLGRSDLREGPGTESMTTTSVIESVERRLDRIELAVQSLTSSVNQVLGTVKSARTATYPRGDSHCATSSMGVKEPQLFIGPSHSFSIVRDALSNVEGLRNSSTSITEHQNAREDLNDLSTAIATAAVDVQGPEEADSAMGFHVPTKQAGYGFISRFLQNVEPGEAIFFVPPDDVLVQVVFHPDKVSQMAWVVFFNYTMLASVSTDPTQVDNMRLFRRNTHLALNNSKIFLQPSEVNIQALMLLAVHGEDFASPNLSWMLAGHACRQAQALGLHLVTSSDYDLQQRWLCLFWTLFAIDKSCSLAFGRPSFLPTTLYRHVPHPDWRHLLKFQPHDTHFFNGKHKSDSTTFGAHVFSQNIELAKLTGMVLDSLAHSEPSSIKNSLRSELDAWYLQTNQLLSQTMEKERDSVNPAQLHEMTLGIRSMKFQYLHILVLLLKDDFSYPELLLASAREAVSILPSMVSNWTSVYNGIIWQLLYYPFTPFFVIFGNIIREPRAPTAQQDLTLLSTAVSYFASMRSQVNLLVNLSSKLEHVATVFLQLARRQVVHSASGTATNTASGVPTNSRTLRTGQSESGDSLRHDGPLGQEIRSSTCDIPLMVDLSMFDVGSMDINSYLDWLPADATVRPRQDSEMDHDPNFPSGSNLSRGRKRPFDSTFDWFSWDTYYAGTGSGS